MLLQRVGRLLLLLVASAMLPFASSAYAAAPPQSKTMAAPVFKRWVNPKGVTLPASVLDSLPKNFKDQLDQSLQRGYRLVSLSEATYFFSRNPNGSLTPISQKQYETLLRQRRTSNSSGIQPMSEDQPPSSLNVYSAATQNRDNYEAFELSGSFQWTSLPTATKPDYMSLGWTPADYVRTAYTSTATCSQGPCSDKWSVDGPTQNGWVEGMQDTSSSTYSSGDLAVDVEFQGTGSGNNEFQYTHNWSNSSISFTISDTGGSVTWTPNASSGYWQKGEAAAQFWYSP